MDKRYYQIRDQAHLMDAEGTSEKCLLPDEIKSELLTRGYNAYDIDIDYDYMMNCWRWGCRIEKRKNNGI